METHCDNVKGTVLVLPPKQFIQQTEFGDFMCQNTRKTEHKGTCLLLWYPIIIV